MLKAITPFNFALYSLILPLLPFEEGAKIIVIELLQVIEKQKSETGRAFCTPLSRFSLVLQAFLIGKIKR